LLQFFDEILYVQVDLTAVVAAWAKGVRRSAERVKERRILQISSRLKAAEKQQTKHHRRRQAKESDTGPIKDCVGYFVELQIDDSMAHIRHHYATSFLLLGENRQKIMCSLGQ
jgi:negative regulator of replication initiation